MAVGRRPTYAPRDFLSSPDSLSLPRFHSPPHRSVSVAASSGASGEVDTSAPPRPLLQRARTPSLSRKNRILGGPTTPSTPVRIAGRPRLPLQEAVRAATKQPGARSSLTVSARTRIHLVCPGLQEECLQ